MDETCAGCDATAPQHPVVGISAGENGRTHKHSVCHDCWATPGHRKHTLKMAFYERDPLGTGAAPAPERPVGASPPGPRVGLVGGSEEQFADVFANAMRVMLRPVLKRLAALEKKPHVKYCGVWQSATVYSVGDAVTAKGSLWIAKLNHLESEPGVDHVGWQLAVKKGRDGKGR